ncbi:PREDICTED: uncharacterized protein LOC109189617 [Ipomoea nil]|uniref:uncharacterized protein LOC109189617 n=1 Tax=Ipomoea nil TaxID=35883 RepID=UPI0009017AF7|nr:PREDICTED: uncharacterized protein LOC109189617 [Ipomoea nil]
MEKKRLQKDNMQLRCMWGFHHFHRSRRNQKVLSNGRTLHKNGKLQPTEPGMLAKRDDEFHKTNVKKPNEKKKKNHAIASTEKHSKEDIGLFDHLIEKSKAERNASLNHSSPVCCSPKEKRGGFQQGSSSVEVHNKNKINVAAILEDICSQIHLENKDAARSVTSADYELVQMSAKAFIDQMFIDRKYIKRSQASCEFTDFSDGFEMLNSNKDLFLKFLRDPNSLLAKQIQSLQLKEMEKETIKSFPNQKFPDKNKIQSEQQLEGRFTDPHQPSNKIVVLKPMPRRVHYTENVACNCSYSVSPQSSSSKRSNGKHKSFSLADIKRKLKSAMGEKLEQLPSTSHKLDYKQNIKVVKTRATTNPGMKNKADKVQDSGNGPEMSCITETVRKKLDLSKQQEFDVFLEAKRHLSRRFINMNEDEQPLESSQTKTLARILDSPERDFWAAQCPKGKVFFGSQAENEEVSSHKHVAKTNEDSPSKSPDRGSSLDVSSSSPISITKPGVSEDVKDKKEHPSPVSVLDLSFMEDVDSPTSLPEKPTAGEMLLQPRRINFEDYSQEDSPSPLNPEKDTISSYIESALQAFYSNWEELWLNTPSPEQLIQPSFFDELELSSLDMHCNPDLLLDYINEVLLETYQCYFGCHPCLSFQPEKDVLLDKVTKEVKHRLCPLTEQPTLDWLVSEDLAKPGLWLDLRINSAGIVSQIAEEIFEESILELLL